MNEGEKMLRGRDRECEQIESLIESALSSRGGSLVVRGDAGIGKTALLESVAAQTGLRVLRVSGVESEMELPYSSLHQLCAWMLPRLDALPSPQADALGTVLGTRAAGAADRFLVNLATLGLISEVARDEPLCCIIEDAQWIDEFSLQTLAFVARRLDADSLVIIFTTRVVLEDLTGIPELVLRGLEERDARALLRSVIPGRLDESIVERIISETNGNPLALLELPKGLRPDQVAGGFGLPSTTELSNRIEEGFLRRVRRLPAATQRLLLLAAADPLGDPGLLWRAGEQLGVGVDDAAAAEVEGLFQIGARATFRHPLVRSAVYKSAATEERRRMHRALAAATDADLDWDRRAWHLAKGSSRADEEIADELEHSAARARGRGGPAAAAAFLELGAQLTEDGHHRARLLLAAANAKYDAGATQRADDLVALIDPTLLSGRDQVELELLHARLAVSIHRATDAPVQLARVAQKLETFSIEAARRTYLHAFAAWLIVGPGLVTLELGEIARAAVQSPPPVGKPLPRDLLLDGIALQLTDGYAAGLSPLRDALRGFVEEPSHTGSIEVLWLACQVALNLWDDETFLGLSDAFVEAAREAGSLVHLVAALDTYVSVSLLAGNLANAEAALAEAGLIHETMGSPPLARAEWALAAWKGVELEGMRTFLLDAIPDPRGRKSMVLHYSSAVALNGLGQYAEAMKAAQSASTFADELNVALWALPELIESAVRSGSLDVAVGALKKLRETTEPSASNWARGIESLGAALVSADDLKETESLYQESVSALSCTRLKFPTARAHLLYGEWLRRTNQRVSAREQLRIARAQFLESGAEGFARRAERELAATGERARKRSTQVGTRLTPQEAQIAALVSDGHSNAQIASQLFISPRTVEYHLHKIFVELGISSRNQLHRALESFVSTPPS